MKKLLLLALLSSTLLLTACDDSYNLAGRTILTDVEDVKIDSEMIGKTTNWTISFKKNGKKQELEFDNLYSSSAREEIESIQKTNKILNNNEKVFYDLVLNGETVVEISLSKNRK